MPNMAGQFRIPLVFAVTFYLVWFVRCFCWCFSIASAALTSHLGHFGHLASWQLAISQIRWRMIDNSDDI